MATKDQIKANFQTGDRPTEAQFDELIEHTSNSNLPGIARSATFNGTNDYIDLDSLAPLVDKAESFQFECYFKTSETTGGEESNTLFSTHRADAANNLVVAVSPVSGSLRVYGIAFGGGPAVDVGAGYNDGVYRHFAVTHNGSTVKIFINRIEVFSTNFTAFSVGKVTIGAEFDSGPAASDFFLGEMHSAAMFINSELIFYFPFQASTGGVVVDYSGKGNNGILRGVSQDSIWENIAGSDSTALPSFTASEIGQEPQNIYSVISKLNKVETEVDAVKAGGISGEYRIEDEIPSLTYVYDVSRSRLLQNTDGTGERSEDSDPIRWVEDLTGNGHHLSLIAGAVPATVKINNDVRMLEHNNDNSTSTTFQVTNFNPLQANQTRWVFGAIRFGFPSTNAHRGLISRINGPISERASLAKLSDLFAYRSTTAIAAYQASSGWSEGQTGFESGDYFVFAIRQSSNPDPAIDGGTVATFDFYSNIGDVISNEYPTSLLAIETILIGESAEANSQKFAGQWLALGECYNDDVSTSQVNRFIEYYSNQLQQTVDKEHIVLRFLEKETVPQFHQGLAVNDDGSKIWAFDTTDIQLMDSDYNILVDNPNALTGLPVGVNHLGGGDYYDGKVYSAALRWNGCADNDTPVIAVYDSETLAYVEHVDLSANCPPGSGVAGLCIVPENDAIYITGFCNSTLYVFRLSDYGFIGEFPMGLSTAQDITYDGTRFWVTHSSDNFTPINADGSRAGLIRTIAGINTIEGAAYLKSERQLLIHNDQDGAGATVRKYDVGSLGIINLAPGVDLQVPSSVSPGSILKVVRSSNGKIVLGF